MRKGFLQGAPKRLTAAAHAPAHATAGPSTAAAAPPAPQLLEPEAFQRSWQQCLELLRSDNDEKKLLHQGGDAIISESVEAVGFQFLQRLLLPLTRRCDQRQQQLQINPQASEQASDQQQQLQEQEVLQCRLALSILGSACRVPLLAASSSVRQLLPEMLLVVTDGGVGPALHSMPGSAAGPRGARTDAGATADADSAADALECILAACSASGSFGEVTRQLALSGGGLAAAVAALRRGVEARGSSSREALMAARLMGVYVSGIDPPQRLQLLESQPQVAAEAVVLLAQLFGAGISGGSIDRGNVGSGGSGGGGGSSSGGSADAAMAQLEALHSLLLLLPAFESPTIAPYLQQPHQQPAVSSMNGGAPMQQHSPWPRAVKAGLGRLLTSRVGEVQKRSALQLAAAMVQLLGHGWLLPAAGWIGSCPAASRVCFPAAAGRLEQQQQQLGPGAEERFVKVLTEVLCVETPLLLSDVMDSEARVPDRREASKARDKVAEAAAAEQLRQEQLQAASRAGEGSDDDDEDMAEQGDGSGQQQQVVQQAQLQSAEATDAHDETTAAAAGGEQGGTEGPLSSLIAAPGDAPERGELQAGTARGTLTARQRAIEQLPSCYMLLEALTEAAAEESAVMERLAALGGDAMEEDGEASHQRLPVLGEEAAQQLVRRLGETTKVILDFLTFMQEHQKAAAVKDPLVLGAIRVLGRFLAEVPDAHSEAVEKLLPFMLQVQCLETSEPHTATGSGANSSTSDGTSGGSSALPLACGVAFLQPALLQSTTSSSERAAAWRQRICDSRTALSALVGHAADLAAVAAAAVRAAVAGAGACGGAAWAEPAGAQEASALEVALMDTCQVLLNVLDGERGMPPALAAAPSQSPAASAHALSHGSGTWGGRGGTGSTDSVQPSVASHNGLGRVTFIVLPLLTPLSAWAVNRRQIANVAAAAAPAPAGSVQASASGQAEKALTSAAALLSALQAAGLRPEVVLAGGAVVALVLGAAAEQLAAAEQRQQQQGQQQQQQQKQQGGGSGGQGALLSEGVVASSCNMIAWALEIGWACRLVDAQQQQEGNEVGQGVRDATQAAAAAGAGPGGQFWWDKDYAAQLWAACLRSAVRVVDNVPALGVQLCQAPWVKQAGAMVGGRGGDEVEDVVAAAVMQSVELQLLLKAL